jgi:lysozyme
MASNNLIIFIRKWEGVRYNPYLCPAGVPTIGCGFTTYLDGTKVTLNDPPLDDIQINRILSVKLDEFSAQVKRILGDNLLVTLPSEAIDALISFAYNLGVGSLAKSTLLKRIKENKLNFDAIEAEFMKWVNAGGKPLEGLKRRRKAEFDMYFNAVISQYNSAEAYNIGKKGTPKK